MNNALAEVEPVPAVQSAAMTVESAVRRLGLGRTLVYQLMADGVLPYHQIGRARRLDPRDVERFWESCRRGGDRAAGAQQRECCCPSETPENTGHFEGKSLRVANGARA